MVIPNIRMARPTMFICGNDERSDENDCDKILDHFGWEAADMGRWSPRAPSSRCASLVLAWFQRATNGCTL